MKSLRGGWLALTVLLSSCVLGYARLPEPAGTDTDPDAEVRVWTQGQLLRLHGTTMLLDSVTGIPADQPLWCDSCRVGIPLTLVDSVFVSRGTATRLQAEEFAKALLSLTFGAMIF